MTTPTLDANNLVWAFQNGDQVQDYELQTTINNVLQTALTGYFNKAPCVCSGVIFTQTGTTNTFNFTGGVIRWQDQILGFNQTGTPVNFTQPAFAKIVAGVQTIIYSNSGDQQYIVAKLNVAVDVAHTNPDNTNTQYAQLTGSILPETKNLTEIQADQTLVPLQTMNLNTGIYSIGVDANCIYRYGQVLEPQVSPPVEINTSTTLTQALNNVIATGNADLSVNMPLIASLTQPYPEFTITNQTNYRKVTINGNGTPLSTEVDTYYAGSTITLELVKGMSPFPNGYWRIKDSFINMPDIVDTPGVSVTVNKPLTVNGNGAVNLLPRGAFGVNNLAGSFFSVQADTEAAYVKNTVIANTSSVVNIAALATLFPKTTTGNVWSTRLSNGILIQFGVVYISGTPGGDTTIALPVTFAHAIAVIAGFGISLTPNFGGTVGATFPDNAHITITFAGVPVPLVNSAFYFVAIGD